MAAPSRLCQQDGISVLPQELLRCIAERLPWGLDVANFRLTGRLWRDAVPLVNFAPLLMLPFDPESAEGTVTFYRPTDGETIKMNLPALHGKVVCGSSHGWLALVDVSATVTLLNPFTGATVDLPPAHKYLARDSSYRYVRMDANGTGWLVHFLDGSQWRPLRLDEVRDVFFREIVLSSALDSGDCVAMALLPCSRDVAFCHVGVDRAWRTLRIDRSRSTDFFCVRSIVHCRGSRFLVVGLTSWEVSICDVAAHATPRVTTVRSLALPHRVNPRGYLNVNGQLHLVGYLMRGRGISYSTQVFKCDIFAPEPRWSRVKDVGDMTLFVSNDFMTGFGGPSVLGLTKNSIYFSEPVDGPRDEEDLDDLELEISDIANGTSKLLSYHNDTGSSSAALCWIKPKPNPWTQ